MSLSILSSCCCDPTRHKCLDCTQALYGTDYSPKIHKLSKGPAGRLL